MILRSGSMGFTRLPERSMAQKFQPPSGLAEACGHSGSGHHKCSEEATYQCRLNITTEDLGGVFAQPHSTNWLPHRPLSTSVPETCHVLP